MFVMLNPGKHSIAIDMKQPRGIELAKRLVSWADVLCENFAGTAPAALRCLTSEMIMTPNTTTPIATHHQKTIM